jgi:hypothetical protein
MIDDALMFAHEDSDNPCPADIAMAALDVAKCTTLRIVDEYRHTYEHFSVCNDLLTKLRADIYKEFND